MKENMEMPKASVENKTETNSLKKSNAMSYEQLGQLASELHQRLTKVTQELHELQRYNEMARLEFLFRLLESEFAVEHVNPKVKLKAIKVITDALGINEVKESKKCSCEDTCK